MGAAMNVAALIVAAGKGERAGTVLPKQYALLGGKSVLAHSVDTLSSHKSIGAVYIVIGSDQRGLAIEALAGRQVESLIIGGVERQDSVRAGLDAIRNAGADAILIHDAARPFVPDAVLDRLIGALDDADGAIPALPVVDTLARSDGNLGDVVDRSGLFRMQTPQAFRLEPLMAAHAAWNGEAATDDAQMVRAAGYKVAVVEGDAMLEKITHAQDFELAEKRLAASRTVRTGMGFDVHRLEAGTDLWLCGVKIEHDRGLAGHSDADVALHAIVDAILGAIGAGDIGSHFPPSESQWRGAASSMFVEHARNLVEAGGGSIDHIDVTIICEAPKIGPYRDAMRARLSDLLRLDPSRVSVKATTTERLGFTGRGEGIAAQAIATVRI